MTSIFRLLSLVILGGLLVACSPKPDAPPQPTAQKTKSLSPQAPNGKPQAKPEPGASGETVNIPANAQWTIYCSTYRGPNHAILARQVKDNVMKSTPLKDWYVVTGEVETTLYHGFYRTIDDPKDPKEVARARKDRDAIDQMRDRIGNRPFSQAMFIALDAADPVAPAEWNLANSKGYWSVSIAAYMDSPQRKEYAVDAVKTARARGIEAYFYHGPVASHVCIGAWPREAVRETTVDSENTDSSETIMVAPHELAGVESIKDRDGNNVKVLTPKIEIVDPTLRQTLMQYPTHSLNGAEMYTVKTDPKTNQRVRRADPSFLFEIPRNQGTFLGTSTPNPSDPYGGAQPSSPEPRQPAPGSRLKSIEN